MGEDRYKGLPTMTVITSVKTAIVSYCSEATMMMNIRSVAVLIIMVLKRNRYDRYQNDR